MVAIRIEERAQNAFNAVASFDGSSEYPVKIADPFLPEEEARLEWYFERATGPQEAAGFRLLHTMIRVLDLEKSLDFYTRHLGMKVLRRQDYPGGRFTLAFIGYGDESDHTVIELTHNWDQKEPYSIGTGYGHMAIGVPDIFGLCERMRASSVKIIREPGPMKHGTTVIAFIEDPDGYKVELIERK